jgi:hypothetical protein
MFVNIGPAEYNVDESVTTLVYGSRAKEITNNTQKNVETQAQARLNDMYKRMQAQLDLAISALKRNNIPIPSDIKVETARDLKLEEDDKVEVAEFNRSQRAPLDNESPVVE